MINMIKGNKVVGNGNTTNRQTNHLRVDAVTEFAIPVVKTVAREAAIAVSIPQNIKIGVFGLILKASEGIGGDYLVKNLAEDVLKKRIEDGAKEIIKTSTLFSGIGFGIGGIIELSALGVKVAQNQDIEDEEQRKIENSAAVGKAAGSLSGSTIGGIVGGVIGSVIPGAGTTIGYFGGSFVGGILGSFAGSSIGKSIAES